MPSNVPGYVPAKRPNPEDPDPRPDKRLGSAAFVNIDHFGSAAQGKKADNAVPAYRTVNGKPLTDDVVLTPADLGLDVDANVRPEDLRLDQSQVIGLEPAIADIVPTTRTINGKPLTKDVVIRKADLGLGRVENANVAEIETLLQRHFDERYQYTNVLLDEISIAHDFEFNGIIRLVDGQLFAARPDVLRDEMGIDKAYLGLDHVDNLSAKEHYAFATRYNDHRYAPRSLYTAFQNLQAEHDRLQSRQEQLTASLSQLATAVVQDPVYARQTKAVAQDIILGLEIEDESESTVPGRSNQQ